MEGGSGALPEHVVETLRSRGWCFRDSEQVKAIATIHCALTDDDARKVLDSVESELANMDLTLFGGKSLPDPSILRKSSHLSGPGPKVLQATRSRNFLFVLFIALCLVPEKTQENPFFDYALLFGVVTFDKLIYVFLFWLFWQIASVRDISKSSIEEFSKSSGGGRRLLRLSLTDGHTEITAIEYSQIPSIPDDVVPGTKVISVAWRFCSAFAIWTYWFYPHECPLCF